MLPVGKNESAAGASSAKTPRRWSRDAESQPCAISRSPLHHFVSSCTSSRAHSARMRRINGRSATACARRFATAHATGWQSVCATRHAPRARARHSGVLSSSLSCSSIPRISLNVECIGTSPPLKSASALPRCSAPCASRMCTTAPHPPALASEPEASDHP